MSSTGTDETLEATGLAAPQVLDAEGRLRKQAIKAALLGRSMDRRIGRYTVERKLGQGGMGVVYAARDDTLDRTVALKLLRGSTDGEDGSLERSRLLREAQALARLRHPAVATVHEVDTHDDEVYLSMEYVDGQTLDAWLAQRPRSWKEVLAVFIQAGEGLAAAHAADIVHRDFKPANVMVEAGGRVVVLDFGLARAHGGDEPDDTHADAIAALCERRAAGAEISSDLTMTGTVVGTPAYMSPEQFLAVRASAASDQFSFCVALYEALTGQRPFPGKTIAEQAKLVTTGDRPRRALGRAPRRVRRAVLRGLRPQPEHRWPSMDALLDELRRALAPNLRWAVMLSLGCISTGLVGVVLTSSEQQTDIAVEPRLTEHAREADDARRMQAALSLEATDPAAAAALLREVEDPDSAPGWLEASQRVLTRPMCSVVLREHGTEPLQTLSFSPDGRFVLSGSRDYTARLWSSDGHGRPWVAQDGGSTAAAFSPDGKTIATIGTVTRLWRWDGDGEPTDPIVVPNGPKRLTEDTTRAIAFDPTGRRIATGSTSGVVYLWDVPDDGTTPRDPRPLRGHDAVIWTVAFSPDGSMLLSSSVDGRGRLWSLAGEEPPLVLEHEDRVFAAHFSPDGTQVLTASFDRAARLWSTADGSLQTRWNHDNALLSAAHTPDGRRVAIGDDRGTIWLRSAVAPDAPSVALRGHEQAVAALAPSPDGRSLASASQDGTARIWTLPADDEDPAPPLVLHAGESLIDVAYAPDGRSIALAGQAGSVRVCSTTTPDVASTREVSGRTLALDADPTGEHLLVGSSAGPALFQGERAITLSSTDGVAPRTIAGAVGSGGSPVVTEDARGALRVWDRSGQTLSLPRDAAGPGPVALDPGGERIAAASKDGSIDVWTRSSTDIQPLGRVEVGGPVGTVRLEAQALLAGDAEGQLWAWSDLDTEPTKVSTGAGMITEIMLDDRGRRLATAHRGGTVIVWRSASSGWEIDRRLSVDGEPSALAWTDSGRTLLTLTTSGLVFRARDDDAEPLVVAALPLEEDSMLGALVDRGRVALTSSGRDGTVHRWELDAFDPDPDRLRARLSDATTECLDPARRMELLGLDEAGARAEYRRCQARFGR